MRAETRHQLKQDRFSRTTIQVAEQTVHWSVEHKSKIIAGAIVTVVVVCAVLGGWYYLQQQDEKASVDFSEAVEAMNAPVRPAGMPAQPNQPSYASANERATDAHKQFQMIVDKYPHTRSADFAQYFLGVISSQLGDNVSAERELKAVSGYRNSELSSLAKLALASVYRNTNRSQDAINVYKEFVQKPTSTVGKTQAEVMLAETYEGTGQTAEAKKIYEQIQKDSAQSEAGQFAAAKLQELK